MSTAGITSVLAHDAARANIIEGEFNARSRCEDEFKQALSCVEVYFSEILKTIDLNKQVPVQVIQAGMLVHDTRESITKAAHDTLCVGLIKERIDGDGRFTSADVLKLTHELRGKATSGSAVNDAVNKLLREGLIYMDGKKNALNAKKPFDAYRVNEFGKRVCLHILYGDLNRERAAAFLTAA